MRWTFYLIIFLCTCAGVYAQVVNPVHWKLRVAPSAAADVPTTLYAEAVIDSGWYLYSSNFSPTLGPRLTTFTFEPDESYALVDSLTPVGFKQGYDSIFEGTYTYFIGKAVFQQQLQVRSMPLRLRGSIDYQVCTLSDGRCVSLTHAFRVTPVTPVGVQGSETESLWGFFFLAFFAGLAALLTPCVFPLIPMTVTYFSGAGGRRQAVLYGVFIVVLYALIGLVLAPFMGPEMANNLATHWLPNTLFFGIFILFGLSFLGLFDIVLPARWVNSVDQKATSNKGIVGVFFMALTLVLVTFSCTGPIIGSILVASAGGLALKPMVGTVGYALAFAMPFSLFAFFPKYLAALPKSGGWLNTVKVTLGFLELAFAFKFLSIADQAYHWNLLDRDVYLSIWIAIFSFLGLYLLAFIRLPHDSAVEKIGVMRLMVALACIAFVVYLVPGLFGAPLKSLAGYLPPQTTLDFDLMKRGQSLSYSSGTGAGLAIAPSPPPNTPGAPNAPNVRSAVAECETPLYQDFLAFPHGLTGYFDYDQALRCAQAQGRPLFIDFTGHGCVNCREMEARVWSDPRVLQRLQDNFVLVALYVDDRTSLPEAQWVRSTYDGKLKKTIGQKNADLQITRFENNAQPFYTILDAQEQLVVQPRAYDLSVDAFIEFLDQAVTAYEAN